jgi:hypothetical protein
VPFWPRTGDARRLVAGRRHPGPWKHRHRRRRQPDEAGAGRVFFTASRPVTEGKNTGPVNRTNRSVYRDHQFCYVGFSGLPGDFSYRTAAVRTVTAV